MSTFDQSDSSRRPGRWRAYSVSTKSFGKAAAIPPAVQCRTDTGQSVADGEQAAVPAERSGTSGAICDNPVFVAR
ncbi:MAG: hypothetical protein ABW292_07750 [Vicinamibacterales bacterium]